MMWKNLKLEKKVHKLVEVIEVFKVRFILKKNILNLGKAKAWQFKTEIDYEFVQDRFRELSPYRAAEFKRDWNIQSNERATEHIGRGGFQLKSKQKGTLGYTFSGFLRDSIYEGSKHVAQYSLQLSSPRALQIALA